MIVAAVTADPPRTWAGLIALAVAYLLFLASTPLLRKIGIRSSPKALPGAKHAKVQATVGVDTDRTDDTGSGELDWWGRIREVGGVRFRQARQVLRTGTHELEADVDVDVDVPLEDGDERDDGGESAEDYIVRCRDLKVPYAHIVRMLVEHYGLTVDQSKYRIRKVDDARRGETAA